MHILCQFLSGCSVCQNFHEATGLFFWHFWYNLRKLLPCVSWWLVYGIVICISRFQFIHLLLLTVLGRKKSIGEKNKCVPRDLGVYSEEKINEIIWWCEMLHSSVYGLPRDKILYYLFICWITLNLLNATQIYWHVVRIKLISMATTVVESFNGQKNPKIRGNGGITVIC